MTQLHTSAAAGLQWVRAEIEQSLTRARGLIEQHLESPENLQPLQQAAIELHLVNGSAGVVQCYGIVALSEEMAQLLQALQQGRVADRDAAFSGLLGATLQLSDYVDILAESRSECALALLPVINELRVAQGKGVRSEAELVAAELLFLGVRPDPPPMHAADGSVLATARQLLPLYQASLLRWLKLNDNQALLKIGKIAAQIASEASIAAVHELWRGAAACAEAVLTRTLDDTQDIRRLYGRAMQQLQLLAGSGEDAASEKAGDLIYHFVFHLGRSRANTPRANAIRSDYAIERLVPSPQAVEEFRRRLRGPNTLLLNRLAAEIRQELAQAKDRIDLIVRTGSRDSAAVTATTAGLTRVANTLSVLGLSNLQHVVTAQVQAVQSLAAASAPTERWMDVAVALLRIEQGLEDALYRQLRLHADDTDGAENRNRPGADLRESVAALLREALVDLARLKSAVDGYLRGAGADSLSESGRLLGQVASSLRLLEDARAADLTGQLLDCMSGPSFPDRCRDPEWAASFADAVILVEIYLEALRDRRPDAADILQALTQRVAALRAPESVAVPPPAAETAAAPEPPAAASTPSPQAVDDEIRDVFLEEAAEVRANLMASLPVLRRDPQDRSNLQEIRRGFHTLKGSGRMVGATDIGEFAWAVESLLNRCLDGSIQVSPPVVDAVNESVSLLDPLLQSFAAGTAAPQTAALIGRVQHLASGKLLDTQAETELLVVFREDAHERLDEIRGWLDRQAADAGEYEVNEVVRRAFHTLRGSAAIVGLKPVSQLASSLESYLDSLRSGALKLPYAALGVLRDACGAIAGWVDSASTDADVAPWLLRIQQLQQAVPQEAQHAAADHGLADVFASEALDLLQSIEAGIRDWTRTPENREQPRTLKRIYQTLNGAALMANCEAIAGPARALEQLVGELADGAIIPDALFFTRLSALQEKLYQQLDQFRDGVVTGAGAELVREVETLREPAIAAQGPVAAAPEPTAVTPSAPASLAEQLSDEASSDAELQSVFLAEADEILQAMDREADAWERTPEFSGPLMVLKRAAHTLKGSSRMAGVVGIDLVSQRLERLLDEVANGAVAVDAQLFARLRNATDGLYRMIEAIRHGGLPDAGPVLAELEGPLPVSETLLTPAESGAPTPAATVAAAAAAATEPAEDEGKAFDPEMAEVFSAEAAELLEQLETQLGAWQANPSNQSAMLEVQRALHTLKGGARMGGLRAMGSAAHDMETHVNALESSHMAPDPTAFAQLRVELETLQRMHDALRRGETAQLLEPAAKPVETPALEPPVVAAPIVAPVEVVAPAPVVPVEAEPLAAPPAAVGASPWSPLLFWRPDEDRIGAAALRRETARVPVEQLETMLNQAGEISIYRSRLEQQTTELSRSLKEVEETIARIRDQLRGLNIETEAQIAARGLIDAQAPDRYSGDFDPLEMDRFTRMQELSRAIAESVGDLASLHEAMSQGMGVSETLLLQQGRVNTGVQQGLMGTLMVPFSRQVQRLQRLVRQVAQENGKQADIQFTGIEAELDRNVLERMTAPLEHLLRNAVVHGIETPERRRSLGKPDVGEIRLSLAREGTQLMMELADDGHGLDFGAIRGVAIERGLLAADAQISDDDAAQLIFQPGFSTARQLTQDAGRGIGMDVVASEVKQLGGTLELRSEQGRGMRLIIRLPLTLALSQALMVSVGKEMYAIPLSSIEGIVRVPLKQLAEHYADEDGKPLIYGNQSYRVRYLGDYLGVPRHEVSERAVGAILIRVSEGLGGQERRVAVVVDVLHGNREIVSKSAGPQISAISGLSGATILPDGRVVLILDVPELVHERARRAAVIATRAPATDQRQLILVVDDSITMRRVAERVLGKNGYRVATAKDGLDAMAWLQNESPAAILLDIEMPRADGFEVAAFVRKQERIKGVPIIMITSRSGEKHRERARSLGVDRYVIKPYQEEQLMSEVRSVLAGSGSSLVH